MYFNTQRLGIRDLSFRDIDRLFELQNDSKVTKYLSYDSWTYERCQSNIEEWIENYRKKIGPKVYAIEKISNKKMIGIVGLIYFENQVEAEIAIRIMSNEWKKGYGKEAMNGLIERTFDKENLERIIGITHPENHNMRKTFISLGFKDITGESKEEGAKYLLEK